MPLGPGTVVNGEDEFCEIPASSVTRLKIMAAAVIIII